MQNYMHSIWVSICIEARVCDYSKSDEKTKLLSEKLDAIRKKEKLLTEETARAIARRADATHFHRTMNADLKKRAENAENAQKRAEQA